jgi:DNA polymerase-3 subunit beta
MVDEKARAVKFSFSKNLLALESKNPDYGSSYSELEIQYGGEPMSIGFNDRYFVDIMGVSKGDTIEIDLKDEQSPALVKLADDPNYVCVVMPMRL